MNSLGTHWTPASSVWEQSAVLLSYWHSISLGSYTVQKTSTTAIMMASSAPKCELLKAVASVEATPQPIQQLIERFDSSTSRYIIPEPENPSCLQATLASAVVQPSSHTVPQSPFRHTSTLPLKLEDPFLSLMLPWEHPVTQRLQLLDWYT